MIITDTMLLLIYVAIALGISFLCSLLESVLLSITPQYVAMKVNKGGRTGKILKSLKSEINNPLTAILTLNTIAHTMGAAGVGAQVTKIYGNNYLTISSIALTILILFVSEVIPKTIGTNYWRFYASFTSHTCSFLTKLLFPAVWISKIFTNKLIKKASNKQFQQEEFKAISKLAIDQGLLLREQEIILKQLLELGTINIKRIMTPRTVIFMLNSNLTIDQFCAQYSKQSFSRIPVYQDNQDEIIGFVMRNDLLLNKIKGNGQKTLHMIKRDIEVMLESTPILSAFNLMIRNKQQIAAVISEYGSICGIVTMEDIIEHIVGCEIVDENDKHINMQELAIKKNTKDIE